MLIVFLFLVQQSPKKVGEDIQKATMEWKGIRVMVRLSVVNRVVSIIVCFIWHSQLTNYRGLLLGCRLLPPLSLLPLP